MSAATLLAANSIPAQAQDNMIYVAVEPCRLVDTREAGGFIPANTSRDFLVSGAAGALVSQGGNPDGCPDPRDGSGSAPLAISAYIVAVPTATSGPGLLTAFPADQPPVDDAIATVNYAAGQVIGNTTNATLCENTASCTSGPLGIKTWRAEQDVVVDVQGYFYAATGTCPDDMVAVGSVCVDKYEASLWDAATGGAQISPLGSAPYYPCAADGSDCGDGAANAIYARSVETVTPAARPTWYQANQACANVGKRLPSTAEWQMAASGTDETQCPNTSLAETGASPTCISTTGALDMVGNLWEWTAELGGTDFDTDLMSARILGSGYLSGGGSTNSAFDPAPTATNLEFGFRCVR